MNNASSRMLIAVGAAWLAAGPALAQNEEPASDIVVTGDREREERIVAEMARGLTLNPPVDKPVARFAEPVCIGAFGVKRAPGAAFVDRMSANAREAGARVGGADCRPNVLVGFVGNAASDIRRVRKEQPGVFVSIPRWEIERALKEPGPVKVLSSAETRSDSGEAIDPDNPTNKLLSGSRISLPVQRALTAVVVLIDRRSTSGMTAQQLADYATLRALAATRPVEEGTTAARETILSLFGDRDPPDGLTDFDRAYLRALYNGPANARAGTLASEVAREYRRGRP
ncbi:MAG: hypothetical protein ACEQR8_03700 [Cypionkella sp.]